MDTYALESLLLLLLGVYEGAEFLSHRVMFGFTF